MNIEEIMTYLPHRYPMLLVDRIVSLDPGKTCVGIKNVTINEPFFQGHYPGLPLMPGVLIMESILQVGAILIMTQPSQKGKIPVVVGVEGARFKRQVVPGDQLVVNIEMLWFRNSVGKMKAVATVDGETAAVMEASFMILDPPQK
jgi:beta-hydroxyacyl-ACP dehydratase FabZ